MGIRARGERPSHPPQSRRLPSAAWHGGRPLALGILRQGPTPFLGAARRQAARSVSELPSLAYTPLNDGAGQPMRCGTLGTGIRSFPSTSPAASTKRQESAPIVSGRDPRSLGRGRRVVGSGRREAGEVRLNGPSRGRRPDLRRSPTAKPFDLDQCAVPSARDDAPRPMAEGVDSRTKVLPCSTPSPSTPSPGSARATGSSPRLTKTGAST